MIRRLLTSGVAFSAGFIAGVRLCGAVQQEIWHRKEEEMEVTGEWGEIAIANIKAYTEKNKDELSPRKIKRFNELKSKVAKSVHDDVIMDGKEKATINLTNRERMMILESTLQT